jgi:hypothetical protein
MPQCPRCEAEMDDGEVACPQCGYSKDESTSYRTDYAPQELLDLGLSPAFVEFVFLDPKPKPFSSQCEPREYGWPCFLPEDVTVAFPLWSYNADITAVWLRAGEREFVTLCHDDPTAVVLARTDQGLLARLFVTLIEREDWEDREASLRRLRKAAAVAGFGSLDHLVEWHDRHGSSSDFEGQLDQLVHSLDASAG